METLWCLLDLAFKVTYLFWHRSTLIRCTRGLGRNINTREWRSLGAHPAGSPPGCWRVESSCIEANERYLTTPLEVLLPLPRNKLPTTLTAALTILLYILYIYVNLVTGIQPLEKNDCALFSLMSLGSNTVPGLCDEYPQVFGIFNKWNLLAVSWLSSQWCRLLTSFYLYLPLLLLFPFHPSCSRLVLSKYLCIS